MAGAMCDIRRAQMSKVNVRVFGSIGFAVWMVLIGRCAIIYGIYTPRCGGSSATG